MHAQQENLKEEVKRLETKLKRSELSSMDNPETNNRQLQDKLRRLGEKYDRLLDQVKEKEGDVEHRLASGDLVGDDPVEGFGTLTSTPDRDRAT